MTRYFIPICAIGLISFPVWMFFISPEMGANVFIGLGILGMVGGIVEMFRSWFLDRKENILEFILSIIGVYFVFIGFLLITAGFGLKGQESLESYMDVVKFFTAIPASVYFFGTIGIGLVWFLLVKPITKA